MSRREIGTIVIYSSGFLEDHHVKAIRDAAPNAEVVEIANLEEWRARREELAPKLEVALGLPHTEIIDLASLPRFRWLQQTFAGVEWLEDYPELAQSGFVLTNASGVAAIPIAEHVLTLMFSLARCVYRFADAQRDHTWYKSVRLNELDGSTMGIVGLGAIGEKLAEKARGLNMRVIGLRRDPAKSSKHVESMLGPGGLPELLELSDWVVMTTALTSETRGLIGEPELRGMKDTAYLINIARGELVQEKFLIRALREGWIAGAGLDVFEREPLPADSPLWDMQNVVITSHHSGSTPCYADRTTSIIVENVRRYRNGKPLKNIIDKVLGY